MSNAHSFPLLRLPFLALEHIIKQIRIEKQIDFSTLSKRANWAVRASTLRQKFNLTLNSAEMITVTITNSTLNQVFVTLSVPALARRPTVSELNKIITRFSGLFKSLGVTLLIFGRGSHKKIFGVIPTIKQLNVSLNKLHVTSLARRDKLCTQALEMAKEAKAFSLCCETSLGFEPRGLGVYNFEHFVVLSSNWFSLEHLINSFLNCHAVKILYCSQISVQDVNKFFKNWMTGSKMRKFSCSPYMTFADEFTLSSVLNGIPTVAVKKERTQNIYIQQFGDDDCFMIEQVGGVKAIVWKISSTVSMTTEFLLV